MNLKAELRAIRIQTKMGGRLRVAGQVKDRPVMFLMWKGKADLAYAKRVLGR